MARARGRRGRQPIASLITPPRHPAPNVHLASHPAVFNPDLENPVPDSVNGIQYIMQNLHTVVGDLIIEVRRPPGHQPRSPHVPALAKS